jgi:Protein of unknown function (DUF2905)
MGRSTRGRASLTHVGRTIIYLGIALIVVGALWLLAEKLGFGRLPGDIVVRRKGFTLYLPIVSSIVLSVVVSLLLRFLRK